MKSLGRKFFVLLYSSIVVWAAYIATLLILHPDGYAITAFGICVSAQMFLGAAYIGGNVWSDFVKSKYFRSELLDK
jgi:hypothetical protein